MPKLKRWKDWDRVSDMKLAPWMVCNDYCLPPDGACRVAPQDRLARRNATSDPMDLANGHDGDQALLTSPGLILSGEHVMITLLDRLNQPIRGQSC